MFNTNIFGKQVLPGVFAIAVITATTVSAQEESTSLSLEEVTVTGQKISRSLQDTTDSVAVVNSIQIEERDITEFSEVLVQTANAHSDDLGRLSIRGIDAFSVSSGGDSFLASVYVDGASLPRNLITSGYSTWDASQVEVLRGPQSTLQGRNALAGAVVVSTTKPTQEWEGRYRAQFGENGEQEFAIAGGGGLIEDQLAFRFTAELEEFDGFNENVVRSESSDFSDEELYRLKFLLSPKGLDDFSALLSFTHATTEDGDSTTDVPQSGSPFDRRIVTNNDAQTISTETDLVSLELNYEINEQWSLAGITTYSDVNTSQIDRDLDGGSLQSVVGSAVEDTQTLSQELRLTFEYKNLTGLIGAYYFDQDIASVNSGQTQVFLENAGLTVPFLIGAFGLNSQTANFVFSQYAPVNPAILNNTSTTTRGISSFALFADATYRFNDKWDIYGGIRWDNEDQENDTVGGFDFVNVGDLPNPANFSSALTPLIQGVNSFILDAASTASQDVPLTDSSVNEVLPKLGVSYHWTDNLTTSFTVQRGFRSGGVGVNIFRAEVFEFDSEFTDNFELSFRSSWLDGALTANANVFYIDWEDQQVRVQLSEATLDNETINAGASSIKGFELELNYILNETLVVYGSLGQAATEFKEFRIVVPNVGAEDTVFDLSGRSFADAPEWTANIGATYKTSDGLFANLNANYADGSDTLVNPFTTGLPESDPDFDQQNDSRVVVNAQIGYELDSFGIYFIASNLLDEEYISDASRFRERSVSRQSLGNPQQFSVSFRGRF